MCPKPYLIAIFIYRHLLTSILYWVQCTVGMDSFTTSQKIWADPCVPNYMYPCTGASLGFESRVVFFMTLRENCTHKHAS